MYEVQRREWMPHPFELNRRVPRWTRIVSSSDYPSVLEVAVKTYDDYSLGKTENKDRRYDATRIVDEDDHILWCRFF